MNRFLRFLKERAAYQWNRIIISVPFRLAAGKFGIWLMKVGRVLQVRYANWNSEFRLKVKFDPEENGDEDECDIHLSSMLTTDSILSFGSPEAQREKQTPMVRELFGVRGVSKIYLRPYRLTIKKGRVFDWPELMPDIERIVMEHCTKKEEV